ncbi:MAG: Serine/threonine-protein kinase PknB [Planctomycetota bacterium]|jgi:serine/threonine protein kinase
MGTGESASGETRLDQLIANYLERRERGEQPDRESLLRAHPELSDALRSFFAEHDRLQHLGQLDANPGATIVAAGEHVAGEEILGKYRLLERIGEGGMGTVWLAQQKHPVRRQVAIKLIRAGMDSRQVLARFDAERQALALMDHPHIARVFDGGVTDRGRPFFVMEYIKGIPLTEYCDRAQLSLRERLELFVPVCQAVQHAHLKGVVHRDLKPSNILVCLYDGRAVPKVIDFGLARALHHDLTDLTLHTSHGQMVGTPVYMSPEQAEFNNLDIDTRSDVYSLGVILYELLTGLTPLDKQRLQRAAWDEILRLIREEDPLPPSTRVSGSERLPGLAAQRRMDPRVLQRSLSGELDWIVMRALEKERSRRYETSSSLARDIERYLADEAVEACPPSRLYRWRKFVRRHRPQVLAGCTLVLGLFAAVAGLAWGWQQSRLAESRVNQTLRELLRERAAKEQAVAAGQRARDESRTKRAEAIIASIMGVLKNSADTTDLPSGGQKALRQSFRAWSEISDDAERVGVLEAGLTDPAKALALAGQYSSVLQASVGLSRARRQLAIELLAEKQRCRDCAPQVRAVSCLLTLALGATDVPAMAEAAEVLGSGTALREEFERQLWRRLPEFSDTAREAPFELLLSSRVRYENATDRQLDVPEEIRRLFFLERIPCALDWYACVEPPMTKSWPPGLAAWYWGRLIRGLKTGAALVPADSEGDDPGLRGSHFLYRLVPALPDEALADAARDMLGILEISIEGGPGAQDYWTVSRDWMTALLKRLPPEHLPGLTLHLDGLLSRHTDQGTIRTLSPVLNELLPRLHPEQRTVLSRRLFAMVIPAAAWREHTRQTLAWTLGTCVRDLSSSEIEAWLQPFRAMPDDESKVRVAGVLSSVLCEQAPRMSAEAAGVWTDLLWRAVTSAAAARSGSAEQRPSSALPYAISALTPRLSAADRGALVQRFEALTEASGKPLAQDPFFLDTASGTAAYLPPELSARIRTELLAAAVDAAGPGEQAAGEFAAERCALLGATVRHADPTGDGALLEELLGVIQKSSDPGRTTAFIASGLSELVSRGDSELVQRVWKDVLAQVMREKWGVEFRDAAVSGRMFEVDPEEMRKWQQRDTFFSKQLSALFGVLAEKHGSAEVTAAWDDLLQLLQLPGTTTGVFTQWDHTRAELCGVALRTLAARIPEAEVLQRLQELIDAARLDLNADASILSPYTSRGCTMYHGVLTALAPRFSSPTAREAAMWLRQNSDQYNAVILSLTWQAIIPQMDAADLPEFEEHLFESARVTERPGMGPLPWRDICLRLGPEPMRKRWQDLLQLLISSTERESTERLCDLLMAIVDHQTPGERQLAIEPLLARLEGALRLPESTEQQVAAMGIRHFRSVLRLRPEASVQDAIIRLAGVLDAESRRVLAERCLEISLNCDADEDWWLPFREGNFPAAVCGDSEQLIRYLNHVNCRGWTGASLLRRFEELTMHGGLPVLKIESAGRELLVIGQGPADWAKAAEERFHAPSEPWPKSPARRFRDVTDVAAWVAGNRPEWTEGTVQP